MLPSENSQAIGSRCMLASITKFLIALAVLLIPTAARAQVNPFTTGSGAPSGSCTSSQIYLDTTGHVLYTCNNGAWVSMGSLPNPTGGSVSLPTTLTPSVGTWRVARACGTQTNCTQVFWDGHYVIDATSNSTTTVTCPDCNFTSNDAFGQPIAKVGQKVWGTTKGTIPGIDFLIFTTTVCPVTTIASINSATSITLNSACTASGTANVALYWGDDDGAALHGLDATVGCAAVQFPDGGPNGEFGLDSRGFFTTAPTGCNQQITTSIGTPAPYMQGTGFGASQTQIMITPDATWSDAKACTGASENVFIGCTLRGAANIQFLGSGLTSASNANCANGANTIVFSASPASSVINGVDMAGICPGESGMRGIEVNSFDENFELGGVQEVGTVACAAHGASSIVFREDDCLDYDVTGGLGLIVDAGAQMIDFGTYPYAGVVINGKLTSYSTHFTRPTTAAGNFSVVCNSGGIWISYGDYVGVDTLGLTSPPGAAQINSGCQHQTTNSIYTGTATGLTNNGSVISNGGNTMTTLAPSGTGVWSGPDVITGTCQGTPTASSTLFLFGAGQTTTQNCTVTTEAGGYVVQKVPLSGSVFGLKVTAVTSGTATFNVIKCHAGTCAATTLTCALSASTNCMDTAHFDIPVVGDTYAIEEVTGASGNPVNVTASLLAW